MVIFSIGDVNVYQRGNHVATDFVGMLRSANFGGDGFDVLRGSRRSSVEVLALGAWEARAARHPQS